MPRRGPWGMLKFLIDRRISLQSQLRDKTSLLVAGTLLSVLLGDKGLNARAN